MNGHRERTTDDLTVRKLQGFAPVAQTSTSNHINYRLNKKKKKPIVQSDLSAHRASLFLKCIIRSSKSINEQMADNFSILLHARKQRSPCFHRRGFCFSVFDISCICISDAHSREGISKSNPNASAYLRIPEETCVFFLLPFIVLMLPSYTF